MRDDFDMFDLDLDFDGGMDDFFDNMGDPFGGGSFMADFGAPGETEGGVVCVGWGRSVGCQRMGVFGVGDSKGVRTWPDESVSRDLLLLATI